MSGSHRHDSTRSRLSAVFLFGVIAVATVGYLVGINAGVPRREPSAAMTPLITPPRSSEQVSREEESPENADASILAAAYSEMRRAETSPNSQLKATLQQIPQPAFDLFEEFKPSPLEKQQSTLVRASRRAFNGAPPVIPHEVERTNDAACYACHGKGLRIDNRVANRMSHPFLANCTQCHAPPPPGPFASFEAKVETGFVGLPAPLQGERAFPGAPPTIPHSTWMRSDCLACHGREAGWAGLESTHPWRINCEQCHAPSASLNQGLTANPIPLLPGLPIATP